MRLSLLRRAPGRESVVAMLVLVVAFLPGRAVGLLVLEGRHRSGKSWPVSPLSFLVVPVPMFHAVWSSRRGLQLPGLSARLTSASRRRCWDSFS